MAVPVSPILWQNQDRTVTLIDIPHSITAAQASEAHASTAILLSTPAIQSPFTANEPRSEHGHSILQNNTIDLERQHEYERVLEQALYQIRSHREGSWCLERKLVSKISRSRQKRQRSDQSVDEPAHPNFVLAVREHSNHGSLPGSDRRDVKPCSNHEWLCTYCHDPGCRFYCNPSTFGVQLPQVGPTDCDMFAQSSYCIPPQSSFYLGDCADSRPFHACVRNQAQNHETARHFDCILLDPPWPNRSVKRTHKTPGSSYATLRTVDHVAELLLSTDLDMLMAEDCLVGFWVTNKSAIRELLLGEDGIFATWSLHLEEEWIWLKTTVDGVPVYPIDGYWKKPYEVLLLGRRRRIHNPTIPQHGNFMPKRRVLVGVPDLHSRKPCLKTLIEPLLRSQPDGRVLEVFARHLVAGWWSWGNECVKFNAASNWQCIEQSTESSG